MQLEGHSPRWRVLQILVSNPEGKVVIFTAQILTLYQYPVDLLTELKLKSSWRHLSRQFFPGAEHLKVKKVVYLREMGIYIHSTAVLYIYPCSCFYFIMNDISGNKTKNCLRRFIAVDVR